MGKGRIGERSAIMKTHVFVLLIIMFAGVPVVRSDIVWEYDSPLTIVEAITEIESDTYLYEYSFENTDTSTIWDFAIYTDFAVSDETMFTGYPLWVGPSSIQVEDVSPAYDPRNLDSSIAFAIYSSYEYWIPVYGEESGIQPNDEVEGFSYISTIYDPSPKYYSYTTFETNGPGPYHQGTFSAVGQTTPEPCSLLLFAMGAFGIRRINV